MARAKRTERAEARRRYRAASAAPLTDDATDVDASAATATTKAKPTSSGSSKSASQVPPGRVGFSQAFRLSFRPMHVRQDVAALPWIATHTHALWVPVAITLASTLVIIGTNGQGTIGQFMFAYFIQTPAIGGVFIAGFLAPRASWLLGALVGFIAAICYSILVLVYPTTHLSGGAADRRPGARRRHLGARAVAGHRLVLRGRRRLVSTLPRAVQPEPQQEARRRGQGQGPGDGRTRGGSSAKASAKR